MTDPMTTSPLDLTALRWHLWEPKVVGTVESPRGTEYYVAMTLSPESATRIVEVHNALLDRVERAESVYERVEQQALGAEANLEAALKVSRERLARAEAAEKAVAAVRELRNVWFRELENADHLVPLEDVIDATDAALGGTS